MNDRAHARPPEGEVVLLAPGIYRLICPNASPMTYWGTNTYFIGETDITIIDPGPINTQHLNRILRWLAGRPVRQILVTHSHVDHSPLARPLAKATGAPICAYGCSSAGRSTIMKQLAQNGKLGGGEGVDRDFIPDKYIGDKEKIETDLGQLYALHTPGHFGNHLCFFLNDTCFSGDHLMGWSTSLVSPPDGDLTDFMASNSRLSRSPMVRAYPGHGPFIEKAQDRLNHITSHRKNREGQIRAALISCPATAAELTRQIYAGIAPALFPMAERNVLAHLIDLTSRNIAAPEGQLHATSRFHLS